VAETETVGIETVRGYHRVALVAVASLLVALVVLMPIAARSGLRALLNPTAGQIVPIAIPVAPSPFEYADIRVAITALDALSGFVTLRISGYYTCLPPCAGSDRIVFASLDLTEDEADRMPRSVAVTLSPTTPEVAQTLQLPIHGHALRYPFDTYEFLLGVNLQRIDTDGKLQPLTATEAADHLRLTIRDALPLVEMSAPVAIDPTTVRPAGQPYDYLHVEAMTFSRPLYLQLTAAIMVGLVALIAAFTVFMQPLRDLLLGTGGMILAQWGIRDFLVPAGTTYTTLIDVGLGATMGFLLTAICARGLVHLWHRNQLGVARVKKAPAAPAGAEPPSGSPQAVQFDDGREREQRQRQTHLD